MGSFKRIYSFCETPPGVIKAVDCGIGTSANLEFSYFHSDIIENEEFEINTAPDIIQVLQPPFPNSPFLMFNLAASSPNSGISSSGLQLQFINTIEPGLYRFHIQFTIENININPANKPNLLLTLGTTGAVPYTNANTGFFQVSTAFNPPNFFTGTPPNPSLQHLAVIHGVVNLPALATTAVLFKPGIAPNFQEFEFGTFNAEVTRIG
jgi:hypothetical protein